jgi:hypothetical protein
VGHRQVKGSRMQHQQHRKSMVQPPSIHLSLLHASWLMCIAQVLGLKPLRTVHS